MSEHANKSIESAGRSGSTDPFASVIPSSIETPEDYQAYVRERYGDEIGLEYATDFLAFCDLMAALTVRLTGGGINGLE